MQGLHRTGRLQFGKKADSCVDHERDGNCNAFDPATEEHRRDRGHGQQSDDQAGKLIDEDLPHTSGLGFLESIRAAGLQAPDGLFVTQALLNDDLQSFSHLIDIHGPRFVGPVNKEFADGSLVDALLLCFMYANLQSPGLLSNSPHPGAKEL